MVDDAPVKIAKENELLAGSALWKLGLFDFEEAGNDGGEVGGGGGDEQRSIISRVNKI